MIAAKVAVEKLVPGVEFDVDGIACNSNKLVKFLVNFY